MPAVSEAFETYRKFAGAHLQDIYGERLKEAFFVEANHLESGVWLNETAEGGAIRLVWKSMPWGAQLSPVNDIAAGDFNGDGKMEIILAQNHFSNQVETGLWRGSPGCHLEWGQNGFEVVGQLESGVHLPGDTKAIVVFDANGDGLADILAGQNNGPLLRFVGQ